MVRIIFAGLCLLSAAIELTLWVEMGFMAAILFGLVFISLCFWILHMHFSTPARYMVVHQIFHGNPYEVDPEHQIFHSAEPDSLSDQHPGDKIDLYRFIKETNELLNMWNNSPDELPEDEDN